MSATVLEQFSEHLVSLADAAATRVVQVGGRHARPTTGTVFSAERILVAAHSVDPGSGLNVKDAQGEVRQAEFVGADAATGLGVVRVTGLAVEPLQPAGTARAGALALALGRTWSHALSVSVGVVSVVGGPLRTGRGRSIDQVIRADVRLHPLGAGGPLVDAGGRVLGLATGTALRGLPLFVPADIAWRVGAQIAAHGSTRRGYLGVSAQTVRLPERQRAGRAQDTGLLVVATADGSPASDAGLLVGDVLVGFDGRPIDDHDTLLDLLSGERVGKSLGLEIIRGGELRLLQVTVGSAPHR
jgi:S1-C subfamily serine protease